MARKSEDIYGARFWIKVWGERASVPPQRGERYYQRVMEGMTESEVAGLGVGALLFLATMAAPKVDAFIASSQRSSLGMCTRCGDLKVIACSTCRGQGLVQAGSFSMVNDILGPLGNTASESKPCPGCSARG
ncbi:uncharacterized protein LOC116257329 isoform X2 [Nymphaea colorata]|nr:uncharacterized protein LOC116257329 isoform X2 [Nymphaea colorata]